MNIAECATKVLCNMHLPDALHVLYLWQQVIIQTCNYGGNAMAKSANQKLKILYLAQILTTQTDEEHGISLENIQQQLMLHGISAERKSLYDDIETLRTFGVDIQMVKNPTAQYFVAGRDFEIPELKLLVDSVQANQFLTEKKTYALIKKLERLCSQHEAQLMRRQVYVTNRIKTMNESIFYNVDAIHNGIAQDKQISFRYFEYSLEKKKVFRHDGMTYKVSPFALTLNNEKYYLIAYDDEAGMIKHYRVDKMDSICIEDAPRVGHNQYKDIDLAEYSKHTFDMYGGQKESVTIEFANHLAGVVIDRFGKDTALIKKDNEHFWIHVQAAVSPQFYGWVFSMNGDAVIIAPQQVVEGFKSQLIRNEQRY